MKRNGKTKSTTTPGWAAETNHQLIESQLEEFEQSWEMESLETGLDGQLVTAEVEFTGQPHVVAQTEAKFTPPPSTEPGQAEVRL